MANGFRETDAGRDETGEIDPEVFGRQVRQFALDAHRVLRRPDSPVDEVIDLHRRVWYLLHQAPGAQTTAISRWLQVARQAIAARLRAWVVEDLESLVA
jgi:hypothetical protein